MKKALGFISLLFFGAALMTGIVACSSDDSGSSGSTNTASETPASTTTDENDGWSDGGDEYDFGDYDDSSDDEYDDYDDWSDDYDDYEDWSEVGKTRGIYCTDSTETSLTIMWHVVDGAVKYRLVLSKNNNFSSGTMYSPTTVNKKTINGLTSGTTYYIWVVAYNGDGEEAVSSYITAKTAKSSNVNNSDEEKGTVIIKNNSSHKLKDVQWYVTWPTDGNVATGYINAGGSYTYSDATPGTYKKISSAALNGYRVDITKTFTVTANETYTIVITDDNLKYEGNN